MRRIMGCALLLAALSGAACHVMRPVTLTQLVAMKPARAWVTQADQSVVLLTGPLHVAGDTLQGYLNGVFDEIPGAQLKKVVVSVPAPGRTVALSVAAGVGIVGFVYAVAGLGASDKPNPIAGDCDKHPGDPNYGCA